MNKSQEDMHTDRKLHQKQERPDEKVEKTIKENLKKEVAGKTEVQQNNCKKKTIPNQR